MTGMFSRRRGRGGGPIVRAAASPSSPAARAACERRGADGSGLSDTRRINLAGRTVPPSTLAAVRAIASRLPAAGTKA